MSAIRTVWNAKPPEPERVSRDGRHTRVSVELKGHTAAVESMVFVADGAETYAALRPLVRSDVLSVVASGALALHYDFTEITRRDVVRAELVILPVVPVLLLLVFGSVVAAAVPFGVGLLAVAGGMAGTFLLSHVIAGLDLRGQRHHHDRPRGGHRLFALHRESSPRGDPDAGRRGCAGPDDGDGGLGHPLLGPHRGGRAARALLAGARQPGIDRAVRHAGRLLRRPLRAHVPARAAGGAGPAPGRLARAAARAASARPAGVASGCASPPWS